MIQIGKTYKVNHERKGNFIMTVTGMNDEWVTGIIVGGKAHAMLRDNEREKGEEITVRQSFCIFTEQQLEVNNEKNNIR